MSESNYNTATASASGTSSLLHPAAAPPQARNERKQKCERAVGRRRPKVRQTVATQQQSYTVFRRAQNYRGRLPINRHTALTHDTTTDGTAIPWCQATGSGRRRPRDKDSQRSTTISQRLLNETCPTDGIAATGGAAEIWDIIRQLANSSKMNY